MIQYQVIRISGVAVGVGFVDHSGEAAYSEKICETLFDTGNDKRDAKKSEKWANLICSLLNNQLAQKRNEKF